MEKIKLENSQLEDLEDAVILIEQRFGIRFDYNELSTVKNVDELCTHILEKIDYENDDICTSLIAFNQLRKAISETCPVDIKKIFPSTELSAIFPDENRKHLIQSLEYRLGYKLYLLEPNPVVEGILVLLLMAFFIILLFNPIVGLAGISVSGLLLKAAYKYGKRLRFSTIRDWIENTICENYLDYRRDRNTVNKTELRNVLFDWFSYNVAIEKDQLKQGCFNECT